MKTIPLSKTNLTAVCDDEDFSALSLQKWYWHKHNYVCGTRNKYEKIAMHRLVMERAGHNLRGCRVIALDGNYANVQKSNLQVKPTCVSKYGPYFVPVRAI